MDNTLTSTASPRSDISFVRWWRRLTSSRHPPAVHDLVVSLAGAGQAPPLPPPRIREIAPVSDLSRAHMCAADDTTLLLEQLRLAAVVTDARGLVTFVNSAASTLLGLATRDEAHGRPWDRLLRVSGDRRDDLDARLAAPAAGGDGDMLALHLETADGRRVQARIDIQPHPQDRSRRMWLLYDAWEVSDPHPTGPAPSSIEGLIGQSLLMKLLAKQIRDVAPVDIPVLLEGETGTGKELVARAIHAASPRRDRPLIAVNCAGLTESLLSSQLFGHRRGAFTGAVDDQTGLFEAANGGTLFLDEIGDMPLSMQTSLLRALQEREIVRLGESRPRAIDVRVIAATHHSLEQDVAKGHFRRDLFYRIRVAHVLLPPLRQRRDDIPLLATAFLRQFQSRCGKGPIEISRQALAALAAHDWPGNVRELRSAIESAVLLARDGLIRPADLLAAANRCGGTPASEADVPPPAGDAAILQALKNTDGNRARAARLLGMSRSTFYRRLAAMGGSIDDRAIG